MVAPVAALGGSGLFSAAMPVIGSVVSGLFGRRSAKKQNEMQMRMAREQMEFQERMSSTAHQREVKDLLAAGLNPILSGTGGAGSSSPSGAMAPIVGEEEMPGLGQAASSAISARLMRQELANAEQELKNLREEGRVKTIAAENAEEFGRNSAQAMLKQQEALSRLSETQIPGAEALEKLWKDLGEGGELFKAIGAAGPTLGPVLRSLIPLLLGRK